MSKGIYLCINYSVSTVVLKTVQLTNAFREIVRPQSPGGHALASAGQTWAGLVRGAPGVGPEQRLPLRSPAAAPVCVPTRQAFARCCRAGPRPRRPPPALPRSPDAAPSLPLPGTCGLLALSPPPECTDHANCSLSICSHSGTPNHCDPQP